MVAIAEGLTLDETALAELQGGFRGEIAEVSVLGTPGQ